jgi:hypothetical protein
VNRRIALISEHASPLGILGSVDCDGQNVDVGQLAKHLADSGYSVDVFTRRDSAALPEIAEWVNGVRIIHVPAGPPQYVRKEDLLPHMDEFTSYVLKFCRRQRRAYDLMHANCWMSGLVAAEINCYASICPESHHRCLLGVSAADVVDAAVSLASSSGRLSAARHRSATRAQQESAVSSPA